MAINRNLSILAQGASASGVLAVANGGSGVTTSTGTGSIVLSTSPQFSTSLGIGMTPSNVLDITQSANAASKISLLNATSGTAGRSQISLTAGTATFDIYNFSQGYTTSGLAVASGSWLRASGQMSLSTDGASPIVFSTNGTERVRIGSDGSLLVGTTTNSGAGVVRATGGFKTVTGSTSIVGGGPTTIFSMPAGGLYFVYAESAGGSTGYGCSAACVSVPYSSGVLRLAEGTTNNYISVSGANVQVTTSLGTNTYNWSYIFIPST
jgi:hypothetical protein